MLNRIEGCTTSRRWRPTRGPTTPSSPTPSGSLASHRHPHGHEIDRTEIAAVAEFLHSEEGEATS